jgi:hypothetical protein
LVRPGIGEEKVVEVLMALFARPPCKRCISRPNKASLDSEREVLEAAEQDEPLLHCALERLACGVVGEDLSFKD